MSTIVAETSSEPRREFFRRSLRLGAVAALAATAGLLTTRRLRDPQACATGGVCAACGQFAGCGLPLASAARQNLRPTVPDLSPRATSSHPNRT
jgi:hypothetical protein